MNIALIGYGRMGKAIEEIALERNHNVLVRIDNTNDWETKIHDLEACDVAIEFSLPEFALENIHKCLNLNLPVVVGTTGWYEHKNELIDFVTANDKTLFFASNFSLGVNLFFQINQYLASVMNSFEQYEVSVEETHHIHKMDKPSGTAISIAEQIIEAIDRKKHWKIDSEPQNEVLSIEAYREGEVPGTHKVQYDSDVDMISIEHKAKSRRGFALGAVLAAEFTRNKKGFLTMHDLLFAK